MILESIPLSEKYRPATLDQVIGQGEAVAKVRAVLSRGWGGRCWWISGPPGHGKTTLARIIAADGASGIATVEIDASELTLQSLDDLKQTLAFYGPGKGGRAVIVNEAHGLRRGDVLRQLLTIIDKQPKHVAFIFTMTDSGEQLMLGDIADSGPLMSRCQVIRLAPNGNEREIASALRKIARREGLPVRGEAVYAALALRCRSDMRAIFNAIEADDLMVEMPEPTHAKGCPGCGGSLRAGRKYCGTECYLNWLRRRGGTVDVSA
ncbi:MAG: AAA family ATPase [Phycisphaerales bacterium]|nr:AAA family ATPase [Phycisphaerales bacterium]